MKTTTTIIMDTLKWTPKEYEENYFKYYTTWCNMNSGGNFSKYVQLIQNTAINSWFNYEFDKINAQFKEILSVYKAGNIANYRSHYAILLSGIYKLYPGPIVKEIKNNDQFAGLFNPN